MQQAWKDGGGEWSRWAGCFRGRGGKKSEGKREREFPFLFTSKLHPPPTAVKNARYAGELNTTSKLAALQNCSPDIK